MSVSVELQKVRFSVVIPAYNIQDYLRRTVCSVLEQSFQDFEIIIVDDASTDETPQMAQNLSEQDSRIRTVILEENKGPSFARNVGVENARGEWIAFLDGDDTYSSDMLQSVVECERQFNPDVVYPDLQHVASNVDVEFLKNTKQNILRQPYLISSAEFMRTMCRLGIVARPIARKHFLKERGLLFDNSVRYGEDFLYQAQIAIMGARILMIPESTYYYYERPGQLTGSNLIDNSLKKATVVRRILQSKGLHLLPEMHDSLIRHLGVLERKVAYLEILEMNSRKENFLIAKKIIQNPRIVVTLIHVFLKTYMFRFLDFSKKFKLGSGQRNKG